MMWSGRLWPACAFGTPPARTQGIGYYRSAAFKIKVADASREREVGDGGFTGWTAALLADAKERCLISCMATEQLTQLMGSAERA